VEASSGCADARAGGHADRAPAPALVEQRDRAGRTLAGDLHAGDVVADLDRQRELGLALARALRESERGIAERQALEIERAHGAGLGGAARRAQDLHGQRARRVVGPGERVRGCQPALDHRHGPLLDQPRQRRNEIAAAAEIDPVGQPNELDLGRSTEKTPERRQRVRPLDRVGLRLDLFEPHACRRRQLERDVAGRLRQRDQRDAAMISFRARDQVLRHAHARIPGGRGGKAVVDQQRERRLAA